MRERVNERERERNRERERDILLLLKFSQERRPGFLPGYQLITKLSSNI